MNLPETEREVLAYLDEATRSMGACDLASFTTIEIANALSVSRNLASQYLNHLVREGLVVKAGAHPVHYFHRAVLSRVLQAPIETTSYASVDELLGIRQSKRDFEQAIGSNQSLAMCVEQCMAGMSYPPRGLPMLLVGEAGTGKTMLARLTYEFGVNSGAIKRGARFLIIDCDHHCEDAASLEDAYFGTPEHPGWRAQAQDGVIVFKAAEHLPRSVVDDLLAGSSDDVEPMAGFGASLERGGSWQGSAAGATTPRPAARASQAPSASADAAAPVQATLTQTSLAKAPRVFFLTAQSADGEFVQEMLRRTPIIISLPPFHERTLREREELALSFLRAEGRRMGVGVHISRAAFGYLISAHYRENVRELKTYITSCCAEAFLRRDASDITVQVCHLSSGVLGERTRQQDANDAIMIDVAKGLDRSRTNDVTQLFDSMVDLFHRFQAGHIDERQLFEGVAVYAQDFEDYVVFSSGASDVRLDAWERMVGKALDDVNGLHGIDLTRKCAVLVARGIQMQMWSDARLESWEATHHGELLRLYASLVRSHQFARAVVSQVRSEVLAMLGVEMGIPVCIPLFYEAVSCEPASRHRRCAGVILCHGYSTASSMADAANRILKKRVFEAVDMPYDQELADVVPVLRSVVDRLSYCREIAILVDSGSLETVHEDFAGLANLSIGVINNASTGLAVEIGTGLLQGMDIQNVISSAAEACPWRYRVIEGRECEDAVLFCSENGSMAAEKVKMLVVQSFEGSIPVHLMACDLGRLMRNGLTDASFARYNVRAVVGTMNPRLPGVPFVPLEDIIAKDATPLDRVLQERMSAAELEAFHQNLVKNFTLENVIESITILNPQILFDEVKASVEQLGTWIDEAIDDRFSIGLYVHLCCLVERLVTRSALESYADVEMFEREHAAFIDAFTKSFANIAKHYNVEIPVTEIAYVWDYVHAVSDEARAAQAGEDAQGSEEADDSDEF